ncbi:MAG: peptidoglycan bridge formation glycyltransferase FemA/FemB family protein [Chloroflexi bacterium]|nr:peptidoglycan bridge formation glycyltransferase FemA/FemB family protein [Chloroflexota bacterium]MBI5713329.1 peptidoglycan bridge formation glycyltransferase FemA/FemB family protein [Chloroflexota bacterium]
MSTTITATEWDSFVASHPQGHILQTPAWAELKCAFGWTATRIGIKEKGVVVAGAQILFRALPLGIATIAYIPKAPIVNWENESLVKFLFENIDQVCRDRNSIFVKLEPHITSNFKLQTPNFQHPTSNFQLPITNYQLLNSKPIQPQRTLVIDLRPSEDEILAAMKQKTRYNIRLAEKKGVAVSPSDDLDTFNKLMQITGERDQFGVHSSAYYRKVYELFRPLNRAQIFTAYYNDQPLATLMLFILGERAWYFYGGSSNEERNRMPTYLLQWEAMRWAKAHGATHYDLWGVPDEDEATLEANFETRDDGLWGVYRFKRGFGGKLIREPEALDRVYSPMMYKLYRMYMGSRVVT